MEPLTTATIRELLQAPEGPCVSIYQPTHRHHPSNQQDPIRFKNLVRAAEESLRQTFRGRDVRPYVERLDRLANNTAFWNHTLDGLAVLVSADTLRVFQLQRPVPELSVVAESFHVKPLLRIVQSADHYQVLCLTRQTAKLFEGNRDALDELAPDPIPTTLTDALGDQLTSPDRVMHTAGNVTVQSGLGSAKDESDKDAERYFRAVDDAVTTGFSRPSGYPLVLAALTENQPLFRGITRNPALLPRGINGDPGAMSSDQLRAAAWAAVEPEYLARLEKLKEDFTGAAAHGQGTADLSEAARAAAESRVATLLIEADRVIPGKKDPATGAFEFAAIDAPDVDDLLDDLAERVLRTGGDVVIAPKDRMPSTSGLAAIYRY